MQVGTYVTAVDTVARGEIELNCLSRGTTRATQGRERKERERVVPAFVTGVEGSSYICRVVGD